MPAEQRAVIDDALAHLGAADREAVILHYFQEREYAEIAAIQGSTISAPAALLPTITSAVIAPSAPSLLATITNLLITMNKIQITAAAVLFAAIPIAVQQVSKADNQQAITKENAPVTSESFRHPHGRKSTTLGAIPMTIS